MGEVTLHLLENSQPVKILVADIIKVVGNVAGKGSIVAGKGSIVYTKDSSYEVYESPCRFRKFGF